MTFFAQQPQHTHSHAKRFLATKMNELAESSLQRSRHSSNSSEASEVAELQDNSNLDENGVNPSKSCYNDYHEDKDSLEKSQNVSVYGNPLWTEEQKPCHIRERCSEAFAQGDRHDANLVINRLTSEILEEEDGYPSVSMLPQSEYFMYSSDSSDGEDLHPRDNRELPFWKRQFHDVDSRSTSQNSSNFEFNPSIESKDFYEQPNPMHGKLEAHGISHERKACANTGNIDTSDKLTKEASLLKDQTCRVLLRNKMQPNFEREDSVVESEVPESIGISRSTIFSETSFKESNENRSQNSTLNPKDTSNHKSGYKNYDLAASDGKNIFASIIANNRQGIFWSNESLKKDMSTLSPQEEDFLYKNSDLLASFEVQDYDTTNKRIARERELAKESLIQGVYEDHEVCLVKQSESFTKEDIEREYCDIDSPRERGQMLNETVETRHFDDTSSWSSENSEELNPVGQAENGKVACDILTKEDYVNHDGHTENMKLGSRGNTHEDCVIMAKERPSNYDKHTIPFAKNNVTTLALPKRVNFSRPRHRDDNKVPLNKPQEFTSIQKATRQDNVMLHVPLESARSIYSMVPDCRAGGGEMIDKPQEVHTEEKVTQQHDTTAAERDLKAFEQEIHELKAENGRLTKFLKETEQKLDSFAHERVLWEQKKLSEMSVFNAFKENETQRLKKERTKLEKQMKLLAQLPTKKERNEIEELKARIANLTSEHAKKDNLQNLTINRLRRNITDLTDQIYALQEEVRRYERFLHSELDAHEDSRRKFNFSKVTAAAAVALSPAQDALGSKNFLSNDTQSQDETNGNRVSTILHWTRAS